MHILGIRSRTQITPEVLAAADRLIAVGCFSVGTNQVDLDAAERLGVPMFNAPFSNTRSVAELVIGEIVMLLRRIFPRSVSAHAGRLGQVGERQPRGARQDARHRRLRQYRLATFLSRARPWACGWSSTITPTSCATATPSPADRLHELLAQSDVVSLHVPETPATHRMIGAAEIVAMKPGAFLINNARGTVVDLEALAAALARGPSARRGGRRVSAASRLERGEIRLAAAGPDNVILTPHVGGSTEEAQERIGEEVARKLIDYSDNGSTVGAVNFPQAQLPPRPRGTRFIQVHRNVPGMLGKLNELFARHAVNIAAQYYETRGEIGYVVLDADASAADSARCWRTSARWKGRSGRGWFMRCGGDRPFLRPPRECGIASLSCHARRSIGGRLALWVDDVGFQPVAVDRARAVADAEPERLADRGQVADGAQQFGAGSKATPRMAP